MATSAASGNRVGNRSVGNTSSMGNRGAFGGGSGGYSGAVLVPAACVAHPAWEVMVAVGADLVAAVCAVVVCAAAGAQEVNIMNIQKAIVNSTTPTLFWQRLLAAVATAALLLTLVLSFAFHAGAKTNPTARGKEFATPEEAANSLIAAAEKYDEAALTEVLGPGSYDIIHTGEPARDGEKCKEFAAQARGENEHRG